jgi:methyl-accepting chemotaxis protein
MKRNVGMLMVLLFACHMAAHAASKEIIELQEQVKVLGDRIATMQQSFDEKLAALQADANQTANNVKQISTWAAHVDASLKQQTADSDTCADQLSGNSKALREQLDDLRGRLDVIAKQLREVNPAPANNNPAAPAEPNANPQVGKSTPGADTNSH